MTPGPHKGWSPDKFDSLGQAMMLARTSKHYSFAKLAVGTGISPKSLRQIENGEIAPLPEQLAKIEQYLGVPLMRQHVTRIARAI